MDFLKVIHICLLKEVFQFISITPYNIHVKIVNNIKYAFIRLKVYINIDPKKKGTIE